MTVDVLGGTDGAERWETLGSDRCGEDLCGGDGVVWLWSQNVPVEVREGAGGKIWVQNDGVGGCESWGVGLLKCEADEIGEEGEEAGYYC